MTKEQEDALWNAHETAILETWGQEALDTANLAWLVDEVEGILQSKVYSANVIFTTWFDPDTGEVLGHEDDEI